MGAWRAELGEWPAICQSANEEEHEHIIARIQLFRRAPLGWVTSSWALSDSVAAEWVSERARFSDSKHHLEKYKQD
jgi:hypothetical protein